MRKFSIGQKVGSQNRVGSFVVSGYSPLGNVCIRRKTDDIIYIVVENSLFALTPSSEVKEESKPCLTEEILSVLKEIRDQGQPKVISPEIHIYQPKTEHDSESVRVIQESMKRMDKKTSRSGEGDTVEKKITELCLDDIIVQYSQTYRVKSIERVFNDPYVDVRVSYTDLEGNSLGHLAYKIGHKLKVRR